MKEGIILVLTGAAADGCLNDAGVLTTVLHQGVAALNGVLAMIVQLVPTLP